MAKPITEKENTKERTMIKMTIEKDDYMLYPPYFVEKKVGEIRGLSEIDAKLDEKYRDLSALCRRMRG